jgi:hypothetical protein
LKPYQRVSTFARTLSDTAGLGAWLAWMALKGTQHPDGAPIMAGALHSEKTPAGLIDQLANLGGSKTAAETGTRRHLAVSMALQGFSLDGMPEQARAELQAIVDLIRSLGTVVAVEAATVCDEYGTAGSCDLILREPGGRIIVADLKTGSRVNHLECAIQLAAHARSRYWVDGARGDLVAHHLPRLMVIHAPQTGAPPTTVELDPAYAVQAANLAVQVRAIRKQKGTIA